MRLIAFSPPHFQFAHHHLRRSPQTPFNLVFNLVFYVSTFLGFSIVVSVRLSFFLFSLFYLIVSDLF